MAAFEQPSAEEDIGTTAWGASRCGRPEASDHADPSASSGSRFGFWPLGRCCRAIEIRLWAERRCGEILSRRH